MRELSLALLFLTGCAAEVPPVLPTHPASPEACESPRAPMSNVLDLTPPAAPASAPATSPAGAMPGMRMPMTTRTGSQPAIQPSSTAATLPASAPAGRLAVVYTCPMHPEVRSGQPGNCPKCGMKLVPKK